MPQDIPPFWIPVVNPPLDGELADQQTIGRPISELVKRDAFLYNQLQSLTKDAGRLIRTNAPITTAVYAGQVVYWNEAEGAFAPAVAELFNNSSTGAMELSSRSFACGIAVSAFPGDRLGEILMFGCVNPAIDLPSVTITSMLDVAGTPFTDGVYYLSKKVPGKITKTPSFPRIQLGFFSAGMFVFTPRFDGLLNGHVHHEFVLDSRPSASQNTTQSGTISFDGNYKIVDYYSNPLVGGGSTPDIILCIRRNGNALSQSINRLELYRRSVDNNLSKLGITMWSGCRKEMPRSSGANGEQGFIKESLNWPSWGQWITVPDSGIDIAFFDRLGRYGVNELTLAEMVAAQMDVTIIPDDINDTFSGFKIFFPDDLSGWTNANPFDIDTPALAKYVYLSENQKRLISAWPPLPIENTRLERNGLPLIIHDDFEVTLSNLFYINTGSLTPWPVDYSAVNPMSESNATFYRLSFTSPVSDSADQYVTSLTSGSSSLRIERCPGGEIASTGDLKIFLDLNFGIDSQIVEGYDTAFVDVEGIKLKRSPMVSELEAGHGIIIDRPNLLGPHELMNGRLAGKLRISRVDSELSGEFSTVALRNAKQVIKNGLSYIYFLKPSVALTGIDARFRVPFANIPTNAKLRIRALFAGTTSLDATHTGVAIFKAIYKVVRPGVDIDDLQPLATQTWAINFSNNYASNTILPEYPSGTGMYISGPSSTSGFVDGDIVVLDLFRATTSEGFSDTYNGDVAVASLAWQLIP